MTKQIKRKKDSGSDFVRTEAKKYNELASKLLSEAEDLASSGDLEGSKQNVQSAQDYERKAKDFEGRANAFAEVCEICGATKETDTGAKLIGFAHAGGKVHQGFILIRKWHADLKKMDAKGDFDQAKSDPLPDIRDEGARISRAEDKPKSRNDRDRRDDRDKQRQGTSGNSRPEKSNGRGDRDSRADEQRDAFGRSSIRRELPRNDDRHDRDGHRDRGSGRGGDDDRQKRRREDDVDDRRRTRRRDGDSPERQTDSKRHRERDASPKKKEEEKATEKEVKKDDDGSDKDGDDDESGGQNRNRARHMERLFMDLMVKSGHVTGETTYADLEEKLGSQSEWKSCPEDTRKELVEAFTAGLKNL